MTRIFHKQKPEVKKVQEPRKKFTCSVCGKNFYYASKFERHNCKGKKLIL